MSTLLRVRAPEVYALRSKRTAGLVLALLLAGCETSARKEATVPAENAVVLTEQSAARRYAVAPRPEAPAEGVPAQDLARAERSAGHPTSGLAAAAPVSGGLGLKGLGGMPLKSAAGARAGRKANAILGAPAEPMNTERYAPIQSNAFIAVRDEPLSTFSIDVDTASYANSRRFLNEGQLPPPDAIRIEEWVNYFPYDYREPTNDRPFAVHAEVTGCPWALAHRLAKVAIKGRSIEREDVAPRNLTFLIDVSGSMQSEDKLPLLKRGLDLLVRDLRPEDRVAVVVYAGASGLVLEPTSGHKQEQILSALERLEAGGSTNGGDGIRLAYQVAQRHFVRGGVNRVILATDGDFNVGTTSEGELLRLIESKRKSGVFLTVLGLGTGNLNDSTMELLADKGNGNYAYIDSLAEARKVLVREAGSTLVTIAKDVKLQVEFNPKQVESYRLVGYENRLLAKQDFNDDAKDAGEIGAGHSVTALYEIVPVGSRAAGARALVDPLKYQTQGQPSQAAAEDELMTVSVRYKLPASATSTRFAETVRDAGGTLARASDDTRFAAAVAHFGLLLRKSDSAEPAAFEAVRALAEGALGRDPNGERRELLSLVDRARAHAGRTH